MFKIIAEGEGIASSNYIRIRTGRFKIKSFLSYVDNSNSTYGFIFYNFVVFTYPGYIIIKAPVGISTLDGGKLVFCIDGEFNCDMLSVASSSKTFGRIEIRNENDVLITDNGKPWADGTYPPDAKNRAPVAGLNAAPAASTNEFADLSGLDPNKEEEITIGERGAGIKHVLEGN